MNRGVSGPFLCSERSMTYEKWNHEALRLLLRVAYVLLRTALRDSIVESETERAILKHLAIR